MIGPHQGKELELMLSGKKHLAMFCEALVEGQDIPELIIPEKAFAPYVQNGVFSRISQDITVSNSPYSARYVFFTTKGQEWRAAAFLAMQAECLAGTRPFDEAHEFFVGRLLGYEESDILHYIDHCGRFGKEKFPAAAGN